jgi:8-oxo-dGTP pyrophosphatase MutT (NUDIX family)
LLWRRLRISLALTGRLTRLKERLAHRHPTTTDDATLIWAAVAVVIAPDPDAILLIRRADRVGDPWSGHMALPGGRRESGDLDLLATAIRETSEEVGFALLPEDLAGTLDDVVPRTPLLPPIAVRPFVFTLTTRPQFLLNPEVADARWVQLDRLLLPESRRRVKVEIQGGSREVEAFHWEDTVVWGMTERILSDLAKVLT